MNVMYVSITPRTHRLLAATVTAQNERLGLMGLRPSDGADLTCYLFSKAVRENAVEMLGEDRVRELETEA